MPFSDAGILDLWERYRHAPAAARALALLTADGTTAWDAAAALSIGERDRRLVRQRMAQFGQNLAAVTDCARCGTALEMRLDAQAFLALPPGETEGELVSEGARLRYRRVTAADLLSAGAMETVEAARQRLLEGCLLEASAPEGGLPLTVNDLTPGTLAALDDAIAALDPAAECLIAFRCAACGTVRTELFDIAAYFWTEVAAEARRILQDVHLLARTYGWSEADILAMPQGRRDLYLNEEWR